MIIKSIIRLEGDPFKYSWFGTNVTDLPMCDYLFDQKKKRERQKRL